MHESINFDKYNQTDGLSSNYVTEIALDQYGFMWVGTQEGLNIFDGKSFLNLSKQSVPNRQIEGSMVQDLQEDKKRSWMWVQNSFASISAIDVNHRTIAHVITHDDQKQSYSEVWARCIGLNDDLLWIGGLNTLSAYHIPSATFLNIDHIRDELIKNGEYNVNKIALDPFGNIWLMIDGYGVLLVSKNLEIVKIFDLGKLQKHHKKLFFWDMELTNESMYLATNFGLLSFSLDANSENIIQTTIDPFFDRVVTGVTSISASELIVATNNDLYSYNKNTLETKILLDKNNNHESLAGVYNLFHDRANKFIWLGTQSGLKSFHYGKEPFIGYFKSMDGKHKLNHLNALLAINENRIIAGANDGVYEIDPGNFQIDQISSSRSNFLLFQIDENHYFVSSDTRNYNLPLSQSISYTQKDLPPDLNANRLNASLNYNDSLLILSSFVQKGLTVWNTKLEQAYTFHPDSLNFQIPDLERINFIFKCSNQNVNILTSKSIVEFNPLDHSFKRSLIVNPKTQTSFNNFMDMNESPDSYFIGTYGDGLVETDKQFKVKRIYTTEDGLSNNCIYRIFNIKNEKMLMTTNNGLSILDLKTKKFKTYYEGDGLHGNGFEQFCGYQKDNKIYVGGPGGFTIVDTDLLPDSSLVPILYPTGITINTHDGKIDTTHLEMTSFTIPNNAFKTTLNFVSPDYKNPDRMKYRYKIDELSKEWVELDNQNFVDLIGINPGKYHFQVIATNSEGINSEPLKMSLEFLPKWYQTIWFKFLLLLLVAGLVYLIQRYRMIQLKKQQLIRKEIANDLHDDIGSTLNSLKIFAHLAQTDTNNKSHIEQIEESISEATVGLRDMIWVLEDEQDSVYEIVERIKKFASPICMANNVALKTRINATTEKPVPKKIKRNIFLITKECINNSIKYAKCSTIKVSFEYTKSILKLSIEDDGEGFDADKVKKGKGLDSMEYRANQIQFKFQVNSSLETGTKTEFEGEIS